MQRSMGFQISRIVAIILNAGLFLFLVTHLTKEGVNLGNAKELLMSAAALAFPPVNILGLSGYGGVIAKYVAFVSNTLVLLFYTFWIALMLVWPLGHGPTGIALAFMWVSYGSIAFIEVILLLQLVRIPRQEAPEPSPGV